MLNQITLVGRLTSDLEIKEVGDSKVANFSLAVPRNYKNAEGEYETDFINCSVWGNIATNTAEYCKKGDVVGVVGRLQIDSYEDKEGNKRHSAKVNVEKVTFLSSKKVETEEVSE